MGNISSRKHLISIHQTIDYQIKSLVPTIKLQGRLSLLMNQTDKVSKFTQNHNNNKSNISNGLKIARNKPLFVHNEQQVNDDDDDNKQNNNDINMKNHNDSN